MCLARRGLWHSNIGHSSAQLEENLIYWSTCPTIESLANASYYVHQSRTLRDEFWDPYRELSEATDRGIQELRAEKTDRATLAVLLTELAMRLGNEYLMSENG